MSDNLGITPEGVHFALSIRDAYRRGEPLLIPGAQSSDKILIPEHLLNPDLDMDGYDGPMALAVMAAKDPESAMALAAAARLGPRGRDRKLIGGVYEVIGDTSRHALVRDCVHLVTREAFSPNAIQEVRHRASHHVFETREQYRAAMTENLRDLLDGRQTPREFLDDFIELAGAGNLHLDIYKRLVVRLIRSEAVRPCLKFMILERLDQFPKLVQLQIVTTVNAAPKTPEHETLKRELRWIYERRRRDRETEKTLAAQIEAGGRFRTAVSWVH